MLDILLRRIDPGNKTWNFKNTPKVVSGIDKESTKKLRNFIQK